MNVAELKVEVYELLTMVNEQSQLEEIKALVSRIVTNSYGHGSYPDGLSKTQYERLMQAFSNSEDESRLVPQEKAHALFEQWKNRLTSRQSL